jgi:hypothetical protein
MSEHELMVKENELKELELALNEFVKQAEIIKIRIKELKKRKKTLEFVLSIKREICFVDVIKADDGYQCVNDLIGLNRDVVVN